ncbi:hypothetical protein DFS33DRAFT_194118 [Desarmillaria ectypa]|nr:hypothetical protein DFS33DRAFT_194118 [Desarmillaria ectypa]
MSSRRSSHSTRTRTSSTTRPPSWRTLSLSKGTAAARVSLVHAEPERGHGAFGSAIDGLPSPKRNGNFSRDIGADVAGPSGLSYEQKNLLSTPQESNTEEMKVAIVPTNSLTSIPSTSTTVTPPTVSGNDQTPPGMCLYAAVQNVANPSTFAFASCNGRERYPSIYTKHKSRRSTRRHAGTACPERRYTL